MRYLSSSGTKDVGLKNTISFNVLVAYEDVTSGLQAKELLERMTRTLPSEDSGWFRCAMWKFNSRMTPARIKVAARQAMIADLIIIATHEREKVPLAIEEWVGLWLPRKAGHPCALVALLEPQGGGLHRARGIHSYLEEVARKGNLSFFADCRNEAPAEARKTNALFDDVFEQSLSLSSQEAGIA
jgi:hypothetical protein